MHVTFNWLKDYVDMEGMSPKEYSDRMTMSGSKVESVVDVGKEISKVVVGRILKVEPHPQADKLVICQVDVGDKELTIVTGAKNVAPAQLIPVALPGATLIGGMKIGVTDLRGVESSGMMCSAGELGMNTSLMSKEEIDGIYIITDEVPVGTDAKPILGLDDVVVEFELTANRSDCQSVIGMARETAATFDEHLVLPVVEISENDGTGSIQDLLSVEVDDPQGCPRYTARMMNVVQNGPSPLWMQHRLLHCGIRPINAIVDVTNYVMLETGQPLHAFDYDKLGSKTILVRNATEGEPVVTLDGNKRILSNQDLVITNGIEPVAIAGVMGGENSDIEDTTSKIVIESANFDKNYVRNTSKRLNFRTDSSSKFEKGIDPELAGFAADRAAQLLLDMGVCQLIKGKLDVYTEAPSKRRIVVDGPWVNRFVGIDLEIDKMASLLERLDLDVEVQGNDLMIEVPTFRQDLEIKEDIAEEIARLYGYNNIPNTIISGTATEGGRTKRQRFELDLKQVLTDKNFYEILTYSFTSENKLMDLNIGSDHSWMADAIPLLNPLGEENRLMRTTLFAGLLPVISHNFNRNIPEGSFYETAVVYEKGSSNAKLPVETKKMSLGMYGETTFFDLKGIVEMLLEKSRISMQSVSFEKGDHPMFHPNRHALVHVNGKEIGIIGEVHPKVVKTYDLPKRTYVGELDLDVLFENGTGEIRFEELPKYPGVHRDLAFLADEGIPAGDIAKVISDNGGTLLKEVELFDVYQGAQIQSGKKSIAYSLYFQATDRTLTEPEIKEQMDRILEACQEELGLVLRDA
ncbi:phenylalanine--tRNA ligase subunit beta [Alkalibacter rhizosphaerae]|uniref:Phenylalanine--tRNA ligase beta subunit n=1 Tax=Alkalibacter rhizosphaerae TaxID=2815577 RepID=A0A974XFN2_9FIRM|nr:phenylalanine--tRNA ligase subunit beta [Alkalibacter rhizosphaerae]QSX08953.1 phenylalanine--tRNA ligase subunit beta [Alkalibacter rhizosphaerae]